MHRVAQQIQSESGPQGPVISLTGEIDVSVSEELDTALRQAADGGEQVAVDLTETTMVDSRTLGVLASCSAELRGRGGELLIVGADSNIMRLFRTIGLEQSFRFLPSRDEIPRNSR